MGDSLRARSDVFSVPTTAIFIVWPLNVIAIFIPPLSVLPDPVTFPTPVISPPLLEQLTFQLIELPVLLESSNWQSCCMSFIKVSGVIAPSFRHCLLTCSRSPPCIGIDVCDRNYHSLVFIFISAAWTEPNRNNPPNTTKESSINSIVNSLLGRIVTSI